MSAKYFEENYVINRLILSAFLGLTLLISCKENANVVSDFAPENEDAPLGLDITQIELTESLSKEEVSIFEKINDLYQIPYCDSINRTIVLDEHDEEIELIASMVYPDTIKQESGDALMAYSFARLKFQNLLNGDGLIEYAYGTDLGQEVRGTVMLHNDEFYHTKIECGYGGCTSTFQKGERMIGQEAITTSSSMTMDNNQL